MINIEHFDNLNENKKSGNFLKEVIDRIFVICKNDVTFKKKDDLKTIENNINILIEKNKKQDKILKQSEKLERDIIKRVSLLDNEIDDMRSDLLETLGSEL